MSLAPCLEAPVAKAPQAETDNDGERDRIDLRVEPSLRRRLNKQATRFGMKLSPYIRQALIKQLEADEASESAPSKKRPRASD